MDTKLIEQITPFLDILGLDDMPMGTYFTSQQPDTGTTPKQAELPTLEKESNGTLDWAAQQETHSCSMGHIWRARKKQTVAWFSADRFGCAGNAFWMGFAGEPTETMLKFVTTDGECYLDSPEAYRAIAEDLSPVKPPKPYVVLKPVDQFAQDEEPVLVSFYARPEILSGLHQLAAYVTADPQVVASPWGPACGGLFTWPMRYLADGKNKAVLGGWDPSARKFFKNDELSFTIPFPMFVDMVTRWKDSFLALDTWALVRKKIDRSKRTWGE